MFVQLTRVVLQAFLVVTPLPTEGSAIEGPSILSTVPENSFALVHCRDVTSLISRAERNDWVRLIGSDDGASIYADLEREFRSETHTELSEMLDLGLALRGESVFFLTQQVAGFFTEPPADRAALAEAMRGWLPDPGPGGVQRTMESGGARIELVAWPDEDAHGWGGRRGHFAAFVDHPRGLGLLSGDDLTTLMPTLESSLAGLATERQAPVVKGYQAARGSAADAGGVEFYVDFTPFVGEAERELARSVEGVLPDPTGLLGLEQGFWLHVAADVFPGTRVDVSARLNVPEDSLAARLADTFEPLPNDLPARLAKNIWSIHAFRWDLNTFYQRARAAVIEKHGEESLGFVDQGLESAKQMGSGVDPIEDVIAQLAGTFAISFSEPDEESNEEPVEEDEGGMVRGDEFDRFAVYLTLVNGEAFLDAFENLVGGGPLESEFELIDIENVDVYTFGDGPFDGGAAFLPDALIVSFGRSVLTQCVRAATGVEGASLANRARFQAAFDECAGSCWFSCVALSGMKEIALPDHEGELRLSPAQGEELGRNPFDSLLITNARRTTQGFEFELRTK